MSTHDWGRTPHPLLSLEQAWHTLSAQVIPLPEIELPLAETHTLVLAEPVTAQSDYPAFDKAMVDGFAVRAADCTTANATLQITGLIPAGATHDQPLQPGQAIRINTGAPLPPGADAVVMIERTTDEGSEGLRVEGLEGLACAGSVSRPSDPHTLTPSHPPASRVVIQTTVSSGDNLLRQGAIRRKGQPILTPPQRLTPAALAAAATAGYGRLTVRPRPTVAIIGTGDEIRLAGAPLSPGQIHDSNGPMLFALMTQFGAAPQPPIIAPDDMPTLVNILKQALAHPVVLTVGGMSMGTLDLVPAACEKLGVRWLFHGVDMRPGKPVAYGRGPQGQHVFGLPGNPVSAYVCSWLFVKMTVDALQGLPPTPPPRQRAILTKDLKPSRDPRPAFLPARVWRKPESENPTAASIAAPTRPDDPRATDTGCDLQVELVPWHGSSDPFGLAAANALFVRPQSTSPTRTGQAVDVILTHPP